MMGAVEISFLYQTRTILRIPSPARKPPGLKPRSIRQRCISTIPNNTPQEKPPQSFLAQKARETSKKARKQPKPTITRTEHQVFEGIFQNLSTRPETIERVTENVSANDTDPDALLKLFIHESGGHLDISAKSPPHTTPSQTGRNVDDHIKRYPPALRNAARRALPPQADLQPEGIPYRSFQPPHMRESPPSPKLTTKSNLKDPRHGIYRPLEAIDNPTVDTTTPAQSNLQLRNFNATKEDEIAQGVFRGKTAEYVENELASISGELKACLTAKSNIGAFKMWDVCERKIFPIVRLLDKKPKSVNRKASEIQITSAAVPDLAPVLTATTVPGAANKKMSKKSSFPQPPTPSPLLKSHPPPNLPAAISPLATVTTLYPTLILLALRLFTTHYPTTPLPLYLYTILQSTSASSRILALNVHFYNTLLSHKWTIYSDLAGLCALLSEMRAAGIEADATTYDVICGIEAERWAELHQDGEGERIRGRGWWLRPEQVRRYAELMEWKVLVARLLLETGRGHLLAEREYSTTNTVRAGIGAGGTGEGEVEIATQPSVWL